MKHYIIREFKSFEEEANQEEYTNNAFSFNPKSKDTEVKGINWEDPVGNKFKLDIQGDYFILDGIQGKTIRLPFFTDTFNSFKLRIGFEKIGIWQLTGNKFFAGVGNPADDPDLFELLIQSATEDDLGVASWLLTMFDVHLPASKTAGNCILFDEYGLITTTDNPNEVIKR